MEVEGYELVSLWIVGERISFWRAPVVALARPAAARGEGHWRTNYQVVPAYQAEPA